MKEKNTNIYCGTGTITVDNEKSKKYIKSVDINEQDEQMLA